MGTIYPEKLEKILKISPGYVPKKINPKDRLKLYHKYWSNEYPESAFKVINIFTIDSIEYYQIKYLKTLFQAAISYPVYGTCYELIQDHNKIRKKDISSILNITSGYYGSEIKYWFFYNNIDLNDKKYCGFKPFIEIEGKNSLCDSKKYNLLANINENGNYEYCHAILSRY